MIPQIIGAVIGAGILGYAVKSSREAAQEKKRRMETPIDFSRNLTREVFEEAVRTEAKKIKRIVAVELVDNGIVKGTVRSQSGISEWKFDIDFNDYGKITGKYWIESSNSDSDIPWILAKRINNHLGLPLEEKESE